jgi:hypothetical protein
MAGSFSGGDLLRPHESAEASRDQFDKTFSSQITDGPNRLEQGILTEGEKG